MSDAVQYPSTPEAVAYKLWEMLRSKEDAERIRELEKFKQCLDAARNTIIDPLR